MGSIDMTFRGTAKGLWLGVVLAVAAPMPEFIGKSPIPLVYY